jgi:hypothetical protein
MNLQQVLQGIMGLVQVRRKGENERVTKAKHLLLRQIKDKMK